MLLRNDSYFAWINELDDGDDIKMNVTGLKRILLQLLQKKINSYVMVVTIRRSRKRCVTITKNMNKWVDMPAGYMDMKWNEAELEEDDFAELTKDEEREVSRFRLALAIPT